MTNSAQSTAVSEDHIDLKLVQGNLKLDRDGVVLGETRDVVKDGDNIYLDLDTILDTRMGTLAKMGTEHAVRALDSGRYHRRMIDEFDEVPKDVFVAEYAKRDLDTLKLSVLTNLVFFLRRLIKDSLMQAIVQQKVERMCFTVNVWPYQFDDPGLVEMLIGCIRFHTYSTSSVRVISMPNEELTPQYCASNFQIMIRYNWTTWLELHKTFFEKKGFPEMTLVVPEIFLDTVPSHDDIERLELRKHNPFQLTETVCAGMFRLKHMPISLFSINETITKENASKVADAVSVTDADINEYLDTHYPKAERIQDNPLPDVDLTDAFELL